jgi:hypothetical protein
VGILSFVVFLCLGTGYSQQVFIQDSFYGGITGGGFSTGLGIGQGTVDVYIEPNSTIMRALLFAYSTGPETSSFVLLNGEPFYFNPSNIIQVNEQINQFYTPTNIHVIDITDFIEINQSNQYTIETIAHPEMPFRGVFAPFIYIQYENPLLPLVNTCLIVNQQFGNGLSANSIINLNPIDSSFPVGFSIYTDRHSYNPNGRSNINFNSNYLGLVYGADNVNFNWGTGVKGHFYYQNNTLYGLDDDVANNTMNESDGLADVSPYISNNSTEVNFTLSQISYPNVLPTQLNLFLAYFLTYTSPCQPFETTLLTSDTTTCANSPVQLGATGGIAYNWLPQTNLSCYDCSDPIFLGDSTTNYTVRIWSTDSCSVVMPVRVRVVPSITLESVFGTPSVCGLDNGTLLATAYSDALPISYQINGGEPQESGLFTNVEAGTYTVTATNAVGCTSSLQATVIEINNVQAAFSVNPSSGTAPLTVQTQNNSQNATEYQWYWENESSTLQNPSITLDTAGVYTLTLVASNGAEHCNDTTSALIFVEEPFVVFAYSYVTDDADVYQIFLSGVSEYRYNLYALDGKLVYRQNGNIEAAGYVDLWEISGVASGMYVFRVRVKDNAGSENDVEGKVVVVR